ncbi:imidazole glycerol phosphate synthase subunit HisF [Gemmata sp. G18]|uniref:imidazole glycerol-phosphate synthase n=1 Tax=Gemmata palustris TaxID=2822762 RepID=A0ABS5BQ77_9BACT|nr:imidazole glycerol phosphate synthase cyclase subunit [Gemmata palustris]MBP3955811.1 imidazole glycerol phosphate synthase subunit HisF [Gemmata palustris]
MIRIIPRLDIKGPNLVKGIRLEGLRVLGRPEQFARHYYEAGADELLYMDAVASLYGRNSLLDIVSRTAREVFIPLTVGGGLRSLDDIRAVLRAGADKVSLNTAAVRRPELVREAARAFGSSTIVISVEAIRQPDGSYHAYTDCGREETGLDAVAWAVRAVELGAGEVLVTSVDREGTGKGFDMELTRRIAEAVPVPVVASGGAGSPAHVSAVINGAGASAVCLASLLHYRAVRELPHQEQGTEGNLEFLRRGASSVTGATLGAVKEHLAEQGIDCRHVLV